MDVHSSKHTKTYNHARQCLYITYKYTGIMDAGMRNAGMRRAHTQARGGHARTHAPAGTPAHEKNVKYLSSTHTKELPWVRLQRAI